MLLDNFVLVDGFLTPRLNYFLQFSSCGPWRVFSHSNSPSHRALGQYRHTSSSRQFCNILCWLEILNYCPDGGNGKFYCSSSIVKATSLICEAQLSFAAHQKYIIFCFSHCDWWLREFGLCFSLLFIFLWNRKPWLDNFMFIITRSAPNCEYEWEYTSEIFYSEFLGVPIIVSNVFLRNFNYDPPPPQKNSYYSMKG